MEKRPFTIRITDAAREELDELVAEAWGRRGEHTTPSAVARKLLEDALARNAKRRASRVTAGRVR